MLRLVPSGKDIDAHQLVWRVNNAPTHGWEAAVGSRTSMRIVNHVPIEKWLHLFANRTTSVSIDDSSDYQEPLCAPIHSEHGCMVSTLGAGASFKDTTLRSYHRSFPNHAIAQLSGALIRFGMRCTAELGGSTPSTGLLTVLLALAVCGAPVSLYGFWPFCCHAHRGWPRMNYKYSHGNRTRWVCCSRGREKMELEYSFYEALAASGLVRLVTGRPPESEQTNTDGTPAPRALSTHNMMPSAAG